MSNKRVLKSINHSWSHVPRSFNHVARKPPPFSRILFWIQSMSEASSVCCTVFLVVPSAANNSYDLWVIPFPPPISHLSACSTGAAVSHLAKVKSRSRCSGMLNSYEMRFLLKLLFTWNPNGWFCMTSHTCSSIRDTDFTAVSDRPRIVCVI